MKESEDDFELSPEMKRLGEILQKAFQQLPEGTIIKMDFSEYAKPKNQNTSS